MSLIPYYNHKKKHHLKDGFTTAEVVNHAVNPEPVPAVVPFEAHLVDWGNMRKYNFCGPGTKLGDRTSGYPHYIIKEGSEPINELDLACYYHDIAYDNRDPEVRLKADAELYKAAVEFEKQGDLSWSDKFNVKVVKGVFKKSYNKEEAKEHAEEAKK
jgi:hypothetical protein